MMEPAFAKGLRPLVFLDRPLDNARDEPAQGVQGSDDVDMEEVIAEQEREYLRREAFQNSIVSRALQSMFYAGLSSSFLKQHSFAAGYPLDPCGGTGPLESEKHYEAQKICQDSVVIHRMFGVLAISSIAYCILGMVALAKERTFEKCVKAIKVGTGIVLVAAAAESARQNFLPSAALTLFCAGTLLSRKFEEKTVVRAFQSRAYGKVVHTIERVENVVYRLYRRVFPG